MRETAYNTVRAVTSLSPAGRTTTANGTTVDRAANLDNYRSALLVVSTGTITDGDHTVTLEVSDNDSDWSDAPAGYIQGHATSTVDAALGDTVTEMGYVGAERYLRATHTVADATTGGVLGAVIVLADARREPVSRTA